MNEVFFFDVYKKKTRGITAIMPIRVQVSAMPVGHGGLTIPKLDLRTGAYI